MKKEINVTQTNEANTQTDEQMFALVNRAIRHEKGYLEKGIDQEVLAAQLGIHRNSLSRLVNRFTGANFSTYIASFRLAEAKRLATTKAYSRVTELASEAGSTSRTAFYRAVKRAQDVTPSTDIKKQLISVKL